MSGQTFSAAVTLLDIQQVTAKLQMVRVSYSATFHTGPPDPWCKVVVGKSHQDTLTAILEQVAPGYYTSGL